MPDNILTSNSKYKLPDCYIYLYHTDEYFILPQYAETIEDTLDTTFAQQSVLSRTAPIYAYSNSGPRRVTFNLDLHRDMMNAYNAEGSNVRLNVDGTYSGDDIITSISENLDYVDILIRKLQSIALPRYKALNKELDPPRVALRLGDQIFIKGVVTSGIGLTYKLPLLDNNKYAQVSLRFTVEETTPYDADSVSRLGSFRGLTSGLKSKMGLGD